MRERERERDLEMAVDSREVECEVFGVKLFSDGSIDRTHHDQLMPCTSANAHQPVLGAYSKDVLIDSTTGCWVRVFLPESAAVLEGEATKLPVLFYFYGGGFVVGSPASVLYHNYCSKVAAAMQSMIICVGYRSAPEHRLPAAYDDCMAALRWLQHQQLAPTTPSDYSQDSWVASHADLSKFFLLGISSGGNILAHLVLKAEIDGMHPLQIRGLIVVVPFFGGVERSNSEIMFKDNAILSLEDTDNLWALCLPADAADRSHPYCNFFTPETRALLHKVKLPPLLVVIGSKDLMYDRQIQYVELVREAGHCVTLLEYNQYDHYILYPEVNRPEDVAEAYSTMKDFLAKCLHESNPAEAE